MRPQSYDAVRESSKIDSLTRLATTWFAAAAMTTISTSSATSATSPGRLRLGAALEVAVAAGSVAAQPGPAGKPGPAG